MKKATLIYWIPRILCIFAILFVSMFALDSFDPNLTIWQQIGGFLIHLVPTYVLILFLVVAWKWELVGGILFLIIGLGLIPFLYIHNYNMNHSVWMSLSVILMLNGPFILVGALFMYSHYLRKLQINAKIQ
jgi:hypothetical protein